MAANINDSIRFWEEQSSLARAVLAAPKGAKRRQAQAALDAHMQNAAGTYLSHEVTYWCKANDISDASPDAQIIGTVVDWAVDFLRTAQTETKRFYEHADKYGLAEAIAWRADDVAKEFGCNESKTAFVNTVRYLARENEYAVPFIHAVIAAGDEALRELVTQGVSMSTRAGHNLVNAYKDEGRRMALREIMRMCDFLRRLAQIW